MEKPRVPQKPKIPSSEDNFDDKIRDLIEQRNAEVGKRESKPTQQTTGTTPSPSPSLTTAQQQLDALKARFNNQSTSGNTPANLSTSMDEARKKLAKLKAQSANQQNSGNIPPPSNSSSGPSPN